MNVITEASLTWSLQHQQSCSGNKEHIKGLIFQMIFCWICSSDYSSWRVFKCQVGHKIKWKLYSVNLETKFISSTDDFLIRNTILDNIITKHSCNSTTCLLESLGTHKTKPVPAQFTQETPLVYICYEKSLGILLSDARFWLFWLKIVYN